MGLSIKENGSSAGTQTVENYAIYATDRGTSFGPHISPISESGSRTLPICYSRISEIRKKRYRKRENDC